VSVAVPKFFHFIKLELSGIDKFYMIELTTAPILIKKFRFGKHKGRNFQEVAKEDSGYLNWMLKNMQDLDSDTRYTIEYWLR